MKKKDEFRMKYCEICGKPIERKIKQGYPEYWSQYQKRRFCSHECANIGHRVPEEEKEIRAASRKKPECHPGKECLNCPYSDCIRPGYEFTPEELQMASHGIENRGMYGRKGRPQ